MFPEKSDAASGPWRGLLLLCLLLITYGSLYPFHVVAPASLHDAWNAFITNFAVWTTRGDVIGNLALFVPLGLLAVLVLPSAQRRGPWLGVVVLASLAFAFGLQVLQIWFPPRDASLADVLWNMVGTLLGMTAGALLPTRPHSGAGSPRDAAIPLVLIAAWVGTQLAPFIPSLDWQGIKSSLKPLLLHPEFSAPSTGFVFSRVLAVACLVAALSGSARAAALHVGLLLAAILLGKLLVVGQTINLSTLLGFVAGFAAWLLLQRARPERGQLIVLLMLFVGYTVGSLMPFALREPPSRFHWLPFEAMLEGDMGTNAWALVEQAFVFGTLLWLCRQIGARVAGVSIVLVLWVAAVEFLQTWIDGRTGDITSALLVLGAGFVIRHGAIRSAGSARGAKANLRVQRT